MSSNKQKYLIQIDNNMCIGAGNCTIVANEIFSLSKQGRVILNNGNLFSNYKNTKFLDLKKAVNNCPVQAIKIINATSKKQIYPK